MTTLLTLGNVTFEDMECPEDIDHLGGYQKIAVHDLPGGERLIQSFGWFPPDVISWSGMFIANPDLGLVVDERVSLLNDMCRLGNSVTLEFGIYRYEVYLWKFYPRPKMEKWFPYTIYVIPLQDLNNAPGPPLAPNNTDVTTQMANQLRLAPGTPLNTSNSDIATAPGTVVNNLSNLPPVAPDPFFNGQNPAVSPANPLAIPNAVPLDIAASLTQFQQNLLEALQQSTGGAGGQINQQPNTPQLIQQAADLQTDLAPLIVGEDSGLSAFAQSTSSSITTIQQQLQPPSAVLSQINVVNPDLMQIAQQYYGDASQWTQIAEANVDADGNTIIVPSLTGTFNLTIPALNTNA